MGPLRESALHAPAQARWRPRLRLTGATVAYLMLLPSIVAFIIFILFPLGSTFVGAFSQVDMLGRIGQFGTLRNVRTLQVDMYLPMVVGHTVLFTVISVGLTTIISFALALLLNVPFAGREVAKSVILLPWAMPFALAAITWRWIFNGELGALNYFLSLFGLIHEPIVWLGNPTLAFGAAIFVNVWSSIPFMAVTLLAGLQAVPGHIYEAAKIDGAGPWEEFRFMTLPQMRMVILIVTLLSTIWAFRAFNIIWILTQGNPIYRTDIVVTYLYKLAFQNNDFGAGFALAVGMFVVLALFSIAYIGILGGSGEEAE